MLKSLSEVAEQYGGLDGFIKYIQSPKFKAKEKARALRVQSRLSRLNGDRAAIESTRTPEEVAQLRKYVEGVKT